MAYIELSNASLAFPIVSEGGRSLRKELIRVSTGGLITNNDSGTVMIQALENIDLRLEEGDRIGLIGHNGAGKSTLLKMLAGIYHPTAGKRKVKGSIRALFELGVGVDHELTGRQNVERLARLYGYRILDVKRDMPLVEEFSGLGGYMDLPVRTYSSGMQLRLLFAVSTMYPSDILLIDEVFGVGDESFQDKAKQRMEKMMDHAKIVVLASHSRDIIAKFCNKTLRMEAGRIVEWHVTGSEQ